MHVNDNIHRINNSNNDKPNNNNSITSHGKKQKQASKGLYRVRQKTGLIFRVDNLAMVFCRKACSMPNVSEFYLAYFLDKISKLLTYIIPFCHYGLP